MQFNLQDQMLKAYIDKIFDKYDTDKSGTLDQDELTYFFNDLFKELGIGTSVTKQQSLEAIKSIDQNSDGGVDKKQLFDAFRKMMANRPPQPQQSMSTSYPPPQPPPQYPPYNQNYTPPPPPPPPYSPYGQNPYQPVYHNPYGVNNPYINQPPPYNPQYPQYNPYQNQGPYNNYPNYPPQYNNYPPQYMNNSNSNMGGSTGTKWGRMQ